MLDLKLIREQPTQVQELLNRRDSEGYDIQPILDLDRQQREIDKDNNKNLSN